MQLNLSSVIYGFGYFYYNIIPIIVKDKSVTLHEHLDFSIVTYYFPIDIIVDQWCTIQQGFLITVLLSS